MFLLDAIRIPQVVQSHYYWKERILSWTELTRIEWTPLPSAPWLQWDGATACLQFRMVVSVSLVPLLRWPSTSTENLQLVGLAAKADLGQMKFILLPENDRLVFRYYSWRSNKDFHHFQHSVAVFCGLSLNIALNQIRHIYQRQSWFISHLKRSSEMHQN